jgi:pimeloyl-ACP methyl ester carboxylesterase
MFVLVHGAWHGAWCWEQVEHHLKEAGVSSVAVDLPGRAGDTRPPAELTLDSYVDHVVAAIDASPAPVTLVGHSLGGLVISQTAERVPEKISSLVYLCAMLLQDGQTTIDAAANDSTSQLMASISLDESGATSSMAEAAVYGLFYGDCSDAAGDKATRLLVPEPVGPATTPVHLTADRWGSVPRSYILCGQDRAISPTAQRAMIESVGVDRVIEMDSSHSPFMSQPERLAAILVDLEH